MLNQDTSRTKTAAIVARAQEDEGYHEELLANPKTAIQEAFGKELPLGLEVRVVEESPTIVYLVLPPRRTAELSDADLQGVVGGFALDAEPARGRRNGWYPLDEWLKTVPK